QWFGTCRDVSESGLGMAGEQYFEPGTKLQVAFHLPEASFYGHAIVRYCQEIRGRYMTGLAFVFDE
ncbi:MAG: PilZ domain-containing protein, partial [bacterium]|nr:PilZ domain-containing protein [bacterium]